MIFGQLEAEIVFVKEALSKGVELVISNDKTYANLEKVIVVEDTVEFMQKWSKK